MNSNLTKLIVFLLMIAGFTACNKKEAVITDVQWPGITYETKPWTRWWWHGSAVTKSDLTAELEAYSKAGLGGVELTPTFGARGFEDRYIKYLTPEWTDMLIHTLNEAKRLGIGVDMATGTGWNFGGPTVNEEDAPQHMVYKIYRLETGEKLGEPVKCIQQPFARFVLNQVYNVGGSYTLPGEKKSEYGGDPPTAQLVKAPDVSEIRQPIGDNNNLQELAIDQINFEKNLPLVVLMAYSDAGEKLNLTAKVDSSGILNWTAPEGNWKLYALFKGWTGKMVERAAPGGEGFMINHFSKAALDHYLHNFDTAFASRDISYLRAYFNDSYEVDDAKYYCDWGPGFLDEFRSRRGYDLENYLPALFGDDDEKTCIRVITDYRETINDLILENFTEEWHRWAEAQGKIIRNQAHGSPGNILDLYAASDIPETEGKDVLRMKFASSAANVTGKKLTSSESATFLNENFTSTLLDLKKNIDRFFTAGVNHVFYHGTAFTPVDEPWPGWFFYVAIHLNTRNPIWQDFPAFNHYVARVQSFMQSGQSDNDILVYFPIYDRYAELNVGRVRNVDGDGPSERMIERFNVDNPRWEASVVRSVMEELQDMGYAYDLVSDKQLENMRYSRDKLVTDNNTYRTIVIPKCNLMPEETFQKLIQLAESGATILFHETLPESVPGLNKLDERERVLDRMKGGVTFSELGGEIEVARLRKGRFIRGKQLEDMLKLASIHNENLVDQGLQYCRRKDADGIFYFILNPGNETLDQWVPVNATGRSAVIFNPQNDEIGLASMKFEDRQNMVYLQLQPAQSCILKIYNEKVDSLRTYEYYKNVGDPVEVNGTWDVTFIKGGPELPDSLEVNKLVSWTDFKEDGVRKFSGTASYKISIVDPGDSDCQGYWLDLGRVKESARVFLNNNEKGVLIGPEYRLFIHRNELQENNTLEVQVTNVGANRIADLDRSGAFWKKFYNNNIRALRAENRGPDGMFTAARWEPFDSGLMGPVTLTPVRIFEPE